MQNNSSVPALAIPAHRSNNFDLIRLVAAFQVVVTHGIEHLQLAVPPNIIHWLGIFPGVPIFFFVSKAMSARRSPLAPSGRCCEARGAGRSAHQRTRWCWCVSSRENSTMLRSLGSFNKQGRRSGLGNRFTQQSVTSLRGKHRIAKSPETIAKDPFEGPFTADEAARELGVTMSTVHRWLREVLAGEQLTPRAPWRIFLTEEVRKRLSGGDAPEGWVGLSEAAGWLGLSKSHVAYLVNTAKLTAVQATVGERRCWRIDVDSAI